MCKGVDTRGRTRRSHIDAGRVVGRGMDNWSVRIRHVAVRSNLFFTRCCATTTATWRSVPIPKRINASRTCARRAVRAEVGGARARTMSHAAVPCATRTHRWTSPPNSTPARIVWCACNPDPWWCSRRAGTPRCADRARYDSEHEPICVREYDACHSERNVHRDAIVHAALPQEELSLGVHPF